VNDENPYRASDQQIGDSFANDSMSFANALPWLTTAIVMLSLFTLGSLVSTGATLYVYFANFRAPWLLARGISGFLLILLFGQLVLALWHYRSRLKALQYDSAMARSISIAHRNAWRSIVVCLGGFVLVSVLNAVAIRLLPALN
jgi:hypothetical protein